MRLNPLSLEVKPKSALRAGTSSARVQTCLPSTVPSLFAAHSHPLLGEPKPPWHSATHSSALRARILHLESWQAMPTSSKQGKQACQGAERASLKVTAVVAGVILQHQLSQHMLFGNPADLAQGCTASRPQSAEAAQVAQTCLCAAVPVRDVQSQLSMLGKPSCCASMPTQTHQSREENGRASAS